MIATDYGNLLCGTAVEAAMRGQNTHCQGVRSTRRRVKEMRHLTHYFQNGPFTLAEQLRQNDQMVHFARDGCLEEGLSGLAGVLSDADEAGDLADSAGGAIAEVV